MKILPSEKHNRTLMVSEIPVDFPIRRGVNYPNDVRELEICINYTGESSGRKAVPLDNIIIPAITKAVNEHAILTRVAKAARLVLNDITAQGNMEAKVGTKAEIELTNSIVALLDIQNEFFS